jgi:hypothetical protein
LFEENFEAVWFISSFPISMEMIVMGKYVLIEGRNRESFVMGFVLMLGTPINIVRMNEDHITVIAFRVCVRFWSMSYVITHSMIESFCQVQHNEVVKVLVEINIVVFVLKVHHPSQDIVSDDNALDPRNESRLITSYLLCVIIKKVSGCSIEIMCLRKPVLKQRVV